MEKNSNILSKKEANLQKGDLGSIGIGAAVAGPFGALLGLGANRLYKWGREAYLKNKAKNKTSDNTTTNDTTKDKKTKDFSDETLQQKIKKAKDDIENSGVFDPSFYKIHQFYQTKIYDSNNPEGNNFIYISSKKDGKKAFENFLNYWKDKYIQKHSTKKLKVSQEEVNEFAKLVQERFKRELNKPCLITVPQYYLIDQNDVLSMAKNSDIAEKVKTIYFDRPSFDSNYTFDNHMYRYQSEAIEEDTVDEYKTSLIILGAYGREYNYAYNQTPGVTDPHKESEKVILDLGQELINDAEDSLYAFCRVCEQLVDNERIITNKYTVAAPLLRKNSTKAEDLEYNAILLNNIGIYDSEEEFKKNYLEDYQQLLDNQMGL